MKHKYTFLFFLQITFSCFAAQKEVASDADGEAPAFKQSYQYRARWIDTETHKFVVHEKVKAALSLGMNPKYLEILDSDRFFALCGGEQYPSPWGRKGEIHTHYGKSNVKIDQFLWYVDFLLNSRVQLPDANLFFMMMQVVPDKVLTKVSVISLFHLASILERRGLKDIKKDLRYQAYTSFLIFYRQMLQVTQEPDWHQLMIELAKTKKESLTKELVEKYLSQKSKYLLERSDKRLTNVRQVMHKVRMELELGKFQKQGRESVED